MGMLTADRDTGGADSPGFEMGMRLLEDMLNEGLQPDAITYTVCMYVCMYVCTYAGLYPDAITSMVCIYVCMKACSLMPVLILLVLDIHLRT
jgi:hypothetical protein